MIKITVLGCGNAFSFKNYNQSFLLEADNGKRMLIDCGTRSSLALRNAKIDPKTLDAVYISHAHGDHAGGLEELAFTCYDWANKPISYRDSPIRYAPKLIGNDKLLNELWNNTLRGGLESMEGFDASLETFFEPCPIKGNAIFTWGGFTFKLIQQVHIMTGSVIKNTFGLIMSKEGHKTVYFTTDSQHCSPRQMEIFYKQSDIIFQDCECIGVKPQTKEFLFSSNVHANYGQLAGYESANSIKLSDEAKSKMWLSHYQDFVSENKDFEGNDCDWSKHCIEDGFAGFLEVGMTFEV